MKYLIRILLIVGLLGGGSIFYYTSKTVNELFGENKKLARALGNLQQESQIGYAKVLEQFEGEEGQLMTRLKFVETRPGRPLEIVLEKEYTIPGDVVHFDALIVSFPDRLVMDGKAKSIYLWRRIYSDQMAPANGLPIEEYGDIPARYTELTEILDGKREAEFWEQIWRLANDPAALEEHQIKAIYGNVVYRKVRPGLIYVFKIGAQGQVYPEVIPDF